MVLMLSALTYKMYILTISLRREFSYMLARIREGILWFNGSWICMIVGFRKLLWDLGLNPCRYDVDVWMRRAVDNSNIWETTNVILPAG